MRRFAASSVVAIVTMFVVVLLVTGADLYLTGHGYPSISRPVVMSMSAADIVLVLSGVAAWAATSWAMRSRQSAKE